MTQIRFALAALIGLALTSGTAATDSKNTNWPCVQRKIPTLSLGMMWAEPAPEENSSAWENDEQIMELSARLAVRRTGIDQAAKLIEEFSERLTPPERTEKLTHLMAAVLQKINAERYKVIVGIERFTRKQRTLADAIRETRNLFSTALAVKTPSKTDDETRQSLEQKLLWQTRIHDERERALTYVCESPVLLEQRAFAIAREIANHLTD